MQSFILLWCARYHLIRCCSSGYGPCAVICKDKSYSQHHYTVSMPQLYPSQLECASACWCASVLRLVLGPNRLCLTCATDPRRGEIRGRPLHPCAHYLSIIPGFRPVLVGQIGGAQSGYRPGERLAVAALKWERFWCIT